MKRKKEFHTCFLIFVLIVTMNLNLISSNAKVYYIPVPCNTIQEAINAANPGDTIRVKPGIYLENIIVNKTLRILGENSQNTVIQAFNTNADVVQIVADSVYISGFTIKDGVNGVSIFSKNCTVTDNIVSNNSIGVRLEGSTNSIISNNTIIKNVRIGIGSGIFLNEGSTKNIIKYNKVLENGEGVYIRGSNNNTISNNFMFKNTKTGICLMKVDSCDYNIIRDNIILNGSCYGIDLWSANHNVIFNNTLKGNGEGFEIQSSNYNIFYQNNLIHNWKGIYLYYSKDNVFYQNNIIGNYIQVSSREPKNLWDNGLEGGNYWSDYFGVDLYSGPYQNETGSDGMGDTPYIITGDNPDLYPLMRPFPWTPWTSHDIGIGDVAISKYIIGQGYMATIRIILFNYGENMETFNVTLYANTTVLTTFTNIALERGESSILFFSWNTTGIPYGNHILKAAATEVQNETDIADNTYTYSNPYTYNMIKITIPGDVTGDFFVNQLDVDRMRLFWQQNPPLPSNEDINGDHIVNIEDAALIGINWQK